MQVIKKIPPQKIAAGTWCTVPGVIYKINIRIFVFERNATILEAISKNGFWFNIKAVARFKPEEYTCISRI